MMMTNEERSPKMATEKQPSPPLSAPLSADALAVGACLSTPPAMQPVQLLAEDAFGKADNATLARVHRALTEIDLAYGVIEDYASARPHGWKRLYAIEPARWRGFAAYVAERVKSPADEGGALD